MVVAIKKIKTKIIGVGGLGTEVIHHIVKNGTYSEACFIIDTNEQDHLLNPDIPFFLINNKNSRRPFCVISPEWAHEALKESEKEIIKQINGCDLILIAGGLGGGTATVSIPVICRLSKTINALTIAVVTLPFSFESSKRSVRARKAIDEINNWADMIVIIPNNRILEMMLKSTKIKEVYKKSIEIIYYGIHGILDLLLKNSDILDGDFDHIRPLLLQSGQASMGAGLSKDIVSAMSQAVTCPLLGEYKPEDISKIIINILPSKGTKLSEVDLAICLIVADGNIGLSLEDIIHRVEIYQENHNRHFGILRSDFRSMFYKLFYWELGTKSPEDRLDDVKLRDIINIIFEDTNRVSLTPELVRRFMQEINIREDILYYCSRPGESS